LSEQALYPGISSSTAMALPIPTKLEEPLIRALDILVTDGLYQSRSEAIRDAVRRLVERNYASRTRFLRVIGEISAHAIIAKYSYAVTDIILYGSAATGEVSEDSDVDILVLASTRRHESVGQLEIHVHETIYPIALASGCVVVPIVLARKKFVDLHRSGEHFTREIVRHGIPLHGTILNELRKQSVPKKS